MERKKASGTPSTVPDFSRPQLPLPPPSAPSSSLPDPNFLKEVQAAFKRHRPLGTMSSNLLRARRVPVQQAPRDHGEGTAEAPPVLPEDSSLTPPSISGTMTGSAVRELKSDECAGGSGSELGSGSSCMDPVSNAVGRIAVSDGCDGKIMAFKESANHGEESSGWALTAKSQGPNPQGHQVPYQYFSTQQADPMTQGSTMCSSYATTMSIHSGPTVQSTNAASAMQTARTHMMAPASESSAMGQVYGGTNLAAKAYEPPGHLKEACGNSGIGRKEPDADGNSSQAQVPPGKNSYNGVVEPPAKAEKVRKKKYDPDLFFKVNGKLYQRLGKIGSGGSSEVYKVISSDCTIYALKRIKLKGRDYPTACGFCQEIEYLNKLKGKSNIIELVDYEVTDGTLLEEVLKGALSDRDDKIKDDSCIYMVLEYGEIDLAHMLSQRWKEAKSTKLDENWMRFYWQQMLEAVNTIHEERIVHSDLKPANFLLVKGSLKLIDFGIAKAIMSDTTNIQRDAQVGTLNYMSPEAFMWNEQDASGTTIKCGRPSDIWSLGCILYQMVYGKTPFADFKTFWAKFKVITDRNYKIEYEPISNPWLIDLMKKCLAWDRDERWRIPQLLQHPFLNPPMPPLDVTNGF